MNILSLSREEIKELVDSGFMRKENLAHYDICRAIAMGKKQNEIADEFNIPDVRLVRYIKEKKCKDCR